MTIKLIGAGFGRTGTTSVKAAYEMLGLGRCYHMLEVIRDQTAVQQWIDATEGKIDWEEIFKGFTATVDWPGAHFWRELIGYYPDAKVLLTVRDSEAWFASTQRTIFQMAKLQKSGAPPAGPDGLLPTNAFKMFEKTVAADIDGELDDKA
ncbi:MAG TPA: sulfotransferase, partial [Alphaproteobacteria bacterium]|nr:sulfotransferase [Alphaproteobacteria bacterium]